MKVFGIGINKTGTKTLGACLKVFGFNNRSYDLELLRAYSEGRMETILEEAEKYDSFEDWPWPLVYRELDQRFPDAKFILTRRRDTATWFDSLCRHAERTGPTEARRIVYGHEMPHEFSELHKEIYERHNREVVEYFRNRPEKLLQICWEDGDGWGKLSSFFGWEIPEIPFPHENKSPDDTNKKKKDIDKYRA